jgi:predicted DsbA family dithiol-disulfide isomerase
VPTYIFDDRLVVVGAQPYEVFRQAMAQLLNEDEDSTQ